MTDVETPAIADAFSLVAGLVVWTFFTSAALLILGSITDIRWLLEAGIHGLIACGIAGGVAYLVKIVGSILFVVIAPCLPPFARIADRSGSSTIPDRAARANRSRLSARVGSRNSCR